MKRNYNIQLSVVLAFCLIITIVTPLVTNHRAEASDQDPFAGRKIIDPAWNLKKVPNYTWGQPYSDAPIVEGLIEGYKFNIPHFVQVVRGERWDGQNVSIGFCVYRFNTAADAINHLNEIFKPAFFASLQKKFTEDEATIKADWANRHKYTYSTGPNFITTADCTIEGGSNVPYYEISKLAGLDFAYVYKSYDWKHVEYRKGGKLADGKYWSSSEGKLVERFQTVENRGIYLIEKEYLLYVEVICVRSSQQPINKPPSCNTSLTITDIPFRDDIWKYVSAGKTETGYCGDGKCQKEKNETCLTCQQDCKCSSIEICDPLSKFANPDTKCSPRVAGVYTNNSGLDARHLAAVYFRKNAIIKFFQEQGYQVVTLDVFRLDDVMETMANPSTKAIAYFGHATEPSICHSDAAGVQSSMIQTLVIKYKALGFTQDEASNLARARSGAPNLDYAYMFTCHSFDNMSLANYLLRSGGTYWGEPGVLTGTMSLSKYVKP